MAAGHIAPPYAEYRPPLSAPLRSLAEYREHIVPRAADSACARRSLRPLLIASAASSLVWTADALAAYAGAPLARLPIEEYIVEEKVGAQGGAGEASSADATDGEPSALPFRIEAHPRANTSRHRLSQRRPNAFDHWVWGGALAC